MSARLGFERLCLNYGAQAVFEDFTLALETGQATCLMGRSGCGKTSLLRLLMGLEAPSAGRVHSLRPLSAVFQEDRLLPWLDAPGNLRLCAGRAGTGRASDLLEGLGLQEALDKPVSAFSGGMKRRLALARALLVPFDLLLDEPFTGLDEATRARAAALIRQFTRGKTVLMASHDPEEARLLGARVIHLP